MSLLAPNKTEMAAFVRKAGYQPDQNYLFALSKMDPTVIGTNALSAPPSHFSIFFEKPYCLIFTPKEIVAKKLSGNKETLRFKKKAVTDFQLRDGLNNSVVITFTCEQRTYHFYTYKNTPQRIAYSAENLHKLIEQNWYHYLK